MLNGGDGLAQDNELSRDRHCASKPRRFGSASSSSRPKVADAGRQAVQLHQLQLRASPERHASSRERELRELLARVQTLAAELKKAEIPELDELVDLFKRRSLQERLEREPENVRVSELAALFRLELQLEHRRAYHRVRVLTPHD